MINLKSLYQDSIGLYIYIYVYIYIYQYKLHYDNAFPFATRFKKFKRYTKNSLTYLKSC